MAPRSLYDRPRRDELEVEAERLAAEIEVGLERLRRILATG